MDVLRLHPRRLDLDDHNFNYGYHIIQKLFINPISNFDISPSKTFVLNDFRNNLNKIFMPTFQLYSVNFADQNFDSKFTVNNDGETRINLLAIISRSTKRKMKTACN